MTIERTGLIKFQGKDVTIIGTDLEMGQKAPEFTAFTQEWAEFKGLADTKGKIRIISSLLSLSTSVCDRETRQFNQEATALDPQIEVIAISMDLPFTLKNWCAAAGVDRVITLSDAMKGDFGEKYGVLIKEKRFLRRAVFVIDANDRVVYSAYMPVLGEEPKYSEVLNSAKSALKG
jgi:thiol peroxidase